MPGYSTIKQGKKYSSSFKVYVAVEGEVVSPFHDIPLYVDGNKELVHVVSEIPRFENAKFEICKNEKFNPIMQDVKKGKPRFVKNVYPTKGYLWNYGALPQTWEDPNETDEDVQAKGDNDPIDVIEIGRRRKEIGEVYQAKVLGSMALVDEDECDWKVVVIDIKDERAAEINTIDDVRKVYKGLLEDTVAWFRDYKIPDGKGRNVFALEGRYMDKKFTMNVIERVHESWTRMMGSRDDIGICRSNSTLESRTRAPMLVSDFLSDEEVPEYIHEYEFIDRCPE